MANKTIYIKSRRAAAFTLMEVMVSSALALVVLLVVCMLSFYSSRSFLAMANYVSMDKDSQLALDRMSKEIRQCRRLKEFSSSSLKFDDVDGKPLHFFWNESARQLLRVADGVTNVYLKDCEKLEFRPFQHTVRSNSFDCYDTANVTDAKVIQVTWLCSSSIMGVKANTESVLSAKVVLRNND